MLLDIGYDGLLVYYTACQLCLELSAKQARILFKVFILFSFICRCVILSMFVHRFYIGFVMKLKDNSESPEKAVTTKYICFISVNGD